MALWILVFGWEVKRMTDRKVYLADGEPLSEELLNMGPSEFQLVEREEEIKDVEFKTEAVSYGKDDFPQIFKK